MVCMLYVIPCVVPPGVPQELMSLFEHKEAVASNTTNQRRQLLEVQGAGECMFRKTVMAGASLVLLYT